MWVGTTGVGKSGAAKFYTNKLKSKGDLVQYYELSKKSIVDDKYKKDIFNGSSSDVDIFSSIAD